MRLVSGDGDVLGLSKEVGQQDAVVVPELVLSLDGGQEITRDQLGSLVDELVKGVLLPIPTFRPDDASQPGSSCLTSAHSLDSPRWFPTVPR